VTVIIPHNATVHGVDVIEEHSVIANAKHVFRTVVSSDSQAK